MYGVRVSSSLPDDRRRATRTPIELRVDYKRLNSFFADYTKNISRGGTFIKTDKPLPVGTDFSFQLRVPGMAAPLILKGRVQWVVKKDLADPSRQTGMGIGFVYDSEAERARVESLVERLMSETLGPELVEKLIHHSKTPSDE